MSLKSRIDILRSTRFFGIISITPFATLAAVLICWFLGVLYENGFYFLMSSYIWTYIAMGFVAAGLLFSTLYIAIVLISLTNKVPQTKLQLTLLIFNIIFVTFGFWTFLSYFKLYNRVSEPNTNSLSQLPDSSNPKEITIDFQQCSKGSGSVYFGMGSTHFSFEGINNGKCEFFYGTEIENPNWDGKLDNKCEVPTSLNKLSFSVDDQTALTSYNGIDLSAIQNYCKKT